VNISPAPRTRNLLPGNRRVWTPCTLREAPSNSFWSPEWGSCVWRAVDHVFRARPPLALMQFPVQLQPFHACRHNHVRFKPCQATARRPATFYLGICYFRQNKLGTNISEQFSTNWHQTSIKRVAPGATLAMVTSEAIQGNGTRRERQREVSDRQKIVSLLSV
jgi:hypothetical protein